MTDDFFRSRLDCVIDARHPLAVLGDKLPWSKLEGSIAPIFGNYPIRATGPFIGPGFIHTIGGT